MADTVEQPGGSHSRSAQREVVGLSEPVFHVTHSIGTFSGNLRDKAVCGEPGSVQTLAPATDPGTDRAFDECYPER